MDTRVSSITELRRLDGSTGAISNTLDARLLHCSALYQRHLAAHFGCVNALEFSASGALLASGGDDRRVLLWDVSKTVSGARTHVVPMHSQHLSNIFCLAFDTAERRLFSAGNDKQIIVHDIVTGAAVDVFTEQQAIYGLSVDPCQENIFVAACESGRVLMFDLRMSLADPHPLAEAASLAAFYSAQFCPAEPRLVAAANSKTGCAIYDVRMTDRPLQKYGVCRYGAMSARFSGDGRRLLLLRRRLPPALYDVASPDEPLCQFDHPRYYNSCTMKSCCFAGSRDQLVLSGSDDFNVYMWRIPDHSDDRRVARAQAVLKGHRSIVNQVRYCPHNGLIASSGVEKIIKLWSPLRMPDCVGGLSTADDEERVPTRRRIARQGEYVDMMVNAGDIFGGGETQSTEEDPRMLAFFDSLVQREIEALTTETDTSEEEDGVRRGTRAAAAAAARQPDTHDHSYFAGASDLDGDGVSVTPSEPPDDIISRIIDVKRRQLMRAARRRRAAAEGAAPPAGDPPPPSSPGPPHRHRLHKARYVWLPMTSALSSRDFVDPTPSAAATTYRADSESDSTCDSALRSRLPSDSGSSDSEADGSSAASSSGSDRRRPAPAAGKRRRRSPDSRRRRARPVSVFPPPSPASAAPAADRPSGSGLQSGGGPSSGQRCRPAAAAAPSSSTSSSSEDDGEQEIRRRVSRKLAEVRARSEEAVSPERAENNGVALTNGHTKDNFSRLKRRNFKGRNYRRKH